MLLWTAGQMFSTSSASVTDAQGKSQTPDTEAEGSGVLGQLGFVTQIYRSKIRLGGDGAHF